MLVSYLRCSFYQNKQKRALKQLFLGHHRYTPVLSVSFSIRVDHGTEPAERVPEGSDLCDFIISEYRGTESLYLDTCAQKAEGARAFAVHTWRAASI